MAAFNFYLFEAGTLLGRAEASENSDILDALERMHTLLDEQPRLAMVQLWRHENFIGHIKRSDGRLILKSKTDPLPAHPRFVLDPATNAS
jgi:hypothetical protein